MSQQREPVRVVVVDDSDVCREALKAALAGDRDVVVVGEGRTGHDAVRLVTEQQPSIITLDLQMPQMDGLQAIEKIMAVRPTPILVITDEPNYQGVDATFEALSRGALELIPKPELWPSSGGEARASSLARQLKLLARVPVIATRRRERAKPGTLAAISRSNVRVLGVGASTGGPTAVVEVLKGLAPSPVPILVVQHIDPAFAASFALWLGKQTGLKARLAEHGDPLVAGQVLVAPPGKNMGLGFDDCVHLSEGAPGALHVPSVDHLFHSLAQNAGSRAAAVLLTGMGDDGARGMLALKGRGALTIAQDKESCVVFGMPGAAHELNAVQHMLPLGEIAATLRKAMGVA